VLKPRHFNGSVDAIGGRVLKGPTFFGPGHHSHSTSEHAAFDAGRDLVRVTEGKNIMTRRTILMLTGMTLLGMSFSPQVALAQSDPFDGIWQLNLAKSNLTGPVAGAKSVTWYFHGEGQNRKLTVVGIDAQGNPVSDVAMQIFDGQPHPTTGLRAWDAHATTRVDAHTVNYSDTKAGKVVVTGTMVVSQDGKTLTITAKGADASGREYNDVYVNDKQ
jgi:hypothetical protein